MNFDNAVISEMKELAVQSYADESVHQFLGRYPLKGLLEELLRTDLNLDSSFIPKNALQRILEKKEVFLALIADPSLQSVIERFVVSGDEDHREFIAQIISRQVDTAEEVLINNAAQSESPGVVGFLKTIYFLLSDSEPQVGLQVSKFLVKVWLSPHSRWLIA
jgi:hypothetical protein